MGSKGFTLIETVIGIGISVVLVVIVVAFLLLSQRSFLIEQGRAQLILDARGALDEMTRKTKEATSVLLTFLSPTGDTYTPDADTVILTLPSIDSANNIIFGSDIVVFEQQGSDLMFLQFPQPLSARSSLTKRLSQKVSDFTLTYLDTDGNPLSLNFPDAKTLRFALTLTDTIRGKQVQTSGEEDATLRNK